MEIKAAIYLEKLMSHLFFLCSLPPAPCAPSILQLTLQNSTVSVSWTADNRKANYTVTADGDGGRHICTTSGNSCNVTDLSCGSIYEFSVSAASAAGPSLSSYTKSHETGRMRKGWINQSNHDDHNEKYNLAFCVFPSHENKDMFTIMTYLN